VSTLVTPRTLFLHIPKTGGTWVTAALQAAGVPCEMLWTRLGPGSRGHATLREAYAYADRFTFAFVRHPLDMYRSRWAGSIRDGWPESRLLHDARSDHFPTFVENVIDLHPGFVGRRFAEFTGPPEAPIAFVGRYESLVDDLVRALTQAGEEHDEDALRAQSPANVNDYTEHRALYDVALAQRVIETEREAMLRWYADDPLPARLLERG
jgi:hypothetical protein